MGSPICTVTREQRAHTLASLALERRTAREEQQQVMVRAMVKQGSFFWGGAIANFLLRLLLFRPAECNARRRGRNRRAARRPG